MEKLSEKQDMKNSFVLLFKKFQSKNEKRMAEIDIQIASVKDENHKNSLSYEKGKTEINPLLETFNKMCNEPICINEEEPVLESTFTMWRECALDLLNPILSKYNSKTAHQLFLYFVHKVDFEYLPEFIKKVRLEYASNINVHDFGLSGKNACFLHAKKNKLYQKLVKVICKWLANMEMVVDTVTRLQQYHIIDFGKENALIKCKSKWKPSSGCIPTRHMLKSFSWNMALKIHGKFGTIIHRLIQTITICHFPISLTFGYGILKALITGTFASKVLIYPTIAISGFIICGFITAMLLKLGENQIKTQKATEDVSDLINCFRETNTNVSDIIRQTHIILLTALEAPNEEEKKIAINNTKNVVAMLIDKKKPVYGYQMLTEEPLEKGHYLIDYFKSKEVEDDWIHISKINIEKAKVQEDLEGSILKLSIRDPESKEEKKKDK